MDYFKNRKILIKALGKVGLPKNLTKRERHAQRRKGVLPAKFNCHHLVCLSEGGDDSIENLSIILVEKHDELHAMLDHIGKVHPHLTEADKIYIKDFAKDYGALTIDMCQRPDIITHTPVNAHQLIA